MSVNVHNYISKLMYRDDMGYTNELEYLAEELSAEEPHQWMIRGSIRNAALPFASDPKRDASFRKLADMDLTRLTLETVDQVTGRLPAPIDDITVHLFPAIDSKGGGCCYAPGKILLCIRCDELAPFRLKRNIAQEYSHTVRLIQKPQATEHGYGPAVPYTMRDYLAFEGLAMVLADSLYPHPAFPPSEVSEESEAAFWNRVDLDAEGMSAYRTYMSKRAYEIASTIVSAYLATHRISIIEAHSRTDEELYWQSGYPHIR